MNNIYATKKVKIVSVSQEAIDTKLFRLQFVEKKIQQEFEFIAGQFMQVGLSGWGECPISICSSSNDSDKFFELAIREIGVLTQKLNQLKKGDEFEVRGPFGNGFNLDEFKNKPLILIGGGCGFVPLRPLILDYLAGRIKNKDLQIFYGCLNKETMLFKKEMSKWNRKARLNIILEKPDKRWAGEKGLVTKLIKKRKIDSDSVVVIVGPPTMYKFVISELKKKKIKNKNIIISLEKKMYCGVGVCQHCAIGPYYVCKDGPVFNWQDVKDYIE